MLVKEREKYEARLGFFIAQHPITISCAQELMQAALRYIQVRAKWFTANPVEYSTEVENLLKRCCLPLTDKYTGRVGDSIELLWRVYQGRANVREMMAHLWAFGNKLLCFDLVGKVRLPDALSIAQEAGLNVAEIEALIEQALVFKANSRHVTTLDPKDDFIKIPWHAVRQLQEATRLPNPVADTEAIWSAETRAEFEAEGGHLSNTERWLRSGLGPEYVPWLDARNMWLPNEAHPFVEAARTDHIPLITGLSGMTMQFMQLARLLNVGPDVNVRLACLGYLLSTKSHSFHEVMVVGEYFGCEYEIGNYHKIEPLSMSEIASHCGALPQL